MKVDADVRCGHGQLLGRWFEEHSEGRCSPRSWPPYTARPTEPPKRRRGCVWYAGPPNLRKGRQLSARSVGLHGPGIEDAILRRSFGGLS